MPTITPRAQPSPTQVVITLSTLITIPNFAQTYPSASPDSFQPTYYTFADGSLVAPPLLDDLEISNICLIITGFLLAIFLRNAVVAGIYVWRGKVKKKGLLYILFLSQLLGPIAIIAIIISQFDRSANCSVVLRITSATSGLSLSLMLTGILGIKVYRCLDNNRLVLAGLVVLSISATTTLILDVVYLRGLRCLSGRCCRPSPGLSSIFVMILLTESFLICACFLYVVWKSHGPVAVRGRISVQLSLDDDTHIQPTESRKEALHSRNRRGWSNCGPPANNNLPTSHSQPPPPLSREPSTTSIRYDDFQRTHTYHTPANAETVPDQNTKYSIPFPSTVHSPPRPCTVRMPTTAVSLHSPLRVATSFNRPISPVHSSMSHFTRYIPRMSLFREVMRDELCYTAVITAFTVVSVAMTLVGVRSTGGINTIWVTLDWALVSLLVMHSFGRVIQRHENESLLLHSSAWYHDLHTDRTTAELLRDVPQPVRAPKTLFRARARRSATRYDTHGDALPSDLSTCRLFPGSAHSSRGDLHSLGASTSGTYTLPPGETESVTRTRTCSFDCERGGPVSGAVALPDNSIGTVR